MRVAWVLGSGGLLGSALTRVLRDPDTVLFQPAGHFSWRDAPALDQQLSAAVQAFTELVGGKDLCWEIYWAAGVGTMGSADSELAPETRAVSHFLRALESEPSLMDRKGALALASSAGAIYAGSTDFVIDESSAPAPTTPYAHEKLKQEALVRSFVDRNRKVHGLLARFSTLYGPGQSIGKRQGLIASIARSMIRKQPIQIFVPLDTIRDYITANDAAARMVEFLRVPYTQQGVETRIVASEQPATIAEIISVFRTLFRRAPRIVTGSDSLGSLYLRRMQFKSIGSAGRSAAYKTSLLVGISQVLAAERAAFASSCERRDI